MRCEQVTTRGQQCKRQAEPNDVYCYQHAKGKTAKVQTAKVKALPQAPRPVQSPKSNLRDANFWLRGNGLEIALPAISGPITVTVLAPHNADEPKIIVFGDSHESSEGFCEMGDAMYIASREFLEAFAQTTDGEVVVSYEAFYQEPSTTALLGQPSILRKVLEQNLPPLKQFMNLLLPCVLRDSKDTPSKKMKWFRAQCPYPNVRVLAGDARKVLFATREVRHRFYWDLLLYGMLTLLFLELVPPHIQNLILSTLAEDVRELKLAGLPVRAILNDVVDAILAVAKQEQAVVDKALFPKAYQQHSLLWKHLKRLQPQEQVRWRDYLTTFSTTVGLQEFTPVLRDFSARLRDLADIVFMEKKASLPPIPRTLQLFALYIASCLMDCYTLLRLHVKHRDAKKVVMFYGFAHATSYVKFFTEVAKSHTVQDTVVAASSAMRCLVPPHDIEL